MAPSKEIHLLNEITPLTEEDCLYVIDRKKEGFNFPVHTHKEFELNFIEGAEDAVRIVGDSVEVIGHYELLLVGNGELGHGWVNHNLRRNPDIREITIQFSPDLFSEALLNKSQFKTIKEMFERAKHGLAFSEETSKRVKPILNSLTTEKRGFYVMTSFMNLLYELSISEGSRILASQPFANVDDVPQSKRVAQITTYIDQNCTRRITLSELSTMVHMSDSALSRFFKHETGLSITDYLINVRIGKASKALLDSAKTISEICFACGFNNVSNFNRLFLKKKGMTPKEFRRIYKKKQVLI